MGVLAQKERRKELSQLLLVSTLRLDLLLKAPLLKPVEILEPVQGLPLVVQG